MIVNLLALLIYEETRRSFLLLADRRRKITGGRSGAFHAWCLEGNFGTFGEPKASAGDSARRSSVTLAASG